MYMLFNNNGFLDARLEKEPVIIPFGWFALPYQDVDEVYVWSDGKNIYGTDVPPPSIYHAWRDGEWIQDEKMLNVLKEEKLKQLSIAAQVYVDSATGGDKLPEFEMQTWAIQAAEAKAWQLDKNVPTPVLDGIATARGIPTDRDLCKIPFLPTAEIQTKIFGCFCFKYPLILPKSPLNPPWIPD